MTREQRDALKRKLLAQHPHLVATAVAARDRRRRKVHGLMYDRIPYPTGS